MNKETYEAFMKQALALSTHAEAGEKNVQGEETGAEPELYSFTA